MSQMSEINEKKLQERVRDRINLPFLGDAASVADSYELWDWQERQAKYIVNSVRVYEQFQLDWWMPLWDIEFVRFWESVPLELREGRVWFKDWIKEEYLSVSGLEKRKNLNNAVDTVFYIFLIKKLLLKLPNPIYIKIKTLWQKHSVNKHFLAFNGLAEEAEMEDLLSKGYNLIGVYSKLFLERRW